MSCKAVYLMAGDEPDNAIRKGLTEAGCTIELTRSITATTAALKAAREAGEATLLVAEVKAGGIALLALLEEQKIKLPGILILDHAGTDIHAVVKALKYGASDYLLASDPDLQREIRARILAERVSMPSYTPARRIGAPATGMVRAGTSTLTQMLGFDWDPAARVIYVGNSYLRLSSIESRLLDLFISKHNQVVSTEELIGVVFNRRQLDIKQGARLLRPHIMRLRNSLKRFPGMAHRIVNLRGTGYMFI